MLVKLAKSTACELRLHNPPRTAKHTSVLGPFTTSGSRESSNDVRANITKCEGSTQCRKYRHVSKHQVKAVARESRKNATTASISGMGRLAVRVSFALGFKLLFKKVNEVISLYLNRFYKVHKNTNFECSCTCCRGVFRLCNFART